jgi:glycosyltransferase involved in cell wall biosynthesis
VRVVAVIPAYNEGPSLPRVLTDLRDTALGSVISDVIVVDDGSDDGTADIAEAFGARVLRLKERLGVGSAMRAGIRYARCLGYRAVVRLDGDGQHGAHQIGAMLAPLDDRTTDAVCGARRRGSGGYSTPLVRRATQALLASLISFMVDRRVTDPTSGFWAFGPRAVDLLAEHHPTGYPESELILLLQREGLRAIEIPVDMRVRASGQSTLTLLRAAMAVARALLALLVVPIRSSEHGGHHE